MKNPRLAVAALAAAGALAWPAVSAATGVASPTDGASDAAVANDRVHQELDQLATTPEGAPLEVVRVGPSVRELLDDEQFLDNVHVLQRHLQTRDAGALGGADVAITELVAIDVRADGTVLVFTR